MLIRGRLASAWSLDRATTSKDDLWQRGAQRYVAVNDEPRAWGGKVLRKNWVSQVTFKESEKTGGGSCHMSGEVMDGRA